MDERETRETPSPQLQTGASASPSPIEVTGEGIQLSTGAKIGIAVGIIVAIIVSILIFGFLVSNPGTTETLRDIAIISLAFESLVILTLLAVLIYQLVVLIAMLRDDVKPMLEATQETLNTVRGTATFVSERVTKPAIQASGYISGITRSLSVVFALRPRRRGRGTTPSAGSQADNLGEARRSQSTGDVTASQPKVAEGEPK